MSNDAQSEFDADRPLMNDELLVLMQLLRVEGKFEEQTNTLVFKQTLDYLRKFSQFSSSDNVSAARSVLFEYHDQFQLTPIETALILNLQVGSADEAFTLIPSLRSGGGPNGQQERIADHELQELIDQVDKFKS